MGFVDVDFYDIVNGLAINNPAIQHCLKKLMYTGARHKGTRLQDLREARDALSRAIDMEAALEARTTSALVDYVKENTTPNAPLNDPRWEVVPAATQGAPVEGYLVRWSIPDAGGRYWWVGHYYAGPDSSLGWCRNAAEGHAKRWNADGKRPEDLRGYTKS
jgi:hypothetical protein